MLDTRAVDEALTVISVEESIVPVVVGLLDGELVDGLLVGVFVGEAVGELLGELVGESVGVMVEELLGAAVGELVGVSVGREEGAELKLDKSVGGMLGKEFPLGAALGEKVLILLLSAESLAPRKEAACTATAVKNNGARAAARIQEGIVSFIAVLKQ